MYLSCREDEKSVVMFNGRVRSYTVGLRGGVGRITHYDSVLKENIRLYKGLFCLFNIIVMISTFSGIMVVPTLVEQVRRDGPGQCRRLSKI